MFLGVFASCSSNEPISVKKIFFENHSYIHFRIDGDFSNHIIHDPHCPCCDEWILYPMDQSKTGFLMRKDKTSLFDK